MLSAQRTYEAGLAHFRANQFAEAESCFRAVAASDPGFAMGHYMLGVALNFLGKWDAAREAFRSAIAAKPTLARAHVGLGSMLERLGRIDEAEAHLRKAIALDPQLNIGYIALAELLRGEGKLRKARAIYESALAKWPDNPQARFGSGCITLLEGDLTTGWNDYEYRLARCGASDPALAPQWRGENPANKTLLLYTEQGLGDTIHFLRYATVLANRGARVLVAVPTTLMELASRADGVHKVISPDSALPRFDYCAPLPSLPLCCKTTLANIPWNGPYLSPPPGRLVAIAPDNRAPLTVALAWAGNPDNPYDYARSLTVSQIEPLLEIRGVRWLILQRGAIAAELEPRNGIVHLGDQLDNFSDIAAVICSADLTISVDTSFCHLAGALGRPVWTLLSYVPDWRWLLQRTDTPWYPTMRLFRQSSPRDWAGVIATVSQALAKHGKLLA
jgi:tetratricopeptide (TPR) repeat protein